MSITFGMMIRALRMGFGWLEQHGCYLRLTVVNDKTFRADVHPPGLIGNHNRGKDEPHVVFWADGEGSPGLNVEEIQGVRALRSCKLPFSFYFDEHGRTI